MAAQITSKKIRSAIGKLRANGMEIHLSEMWELLHDSDDSYEDADSDRIIIFANDIMVEMDYVFDELVKRIPTYGANPRDIEFEIFGSEEE